jgi:6-aminohexanoate-oligomer endohydrolase
MTENRRQFLKNTGLIGAGLAASSIPNNPAFAADEKPKIIVSRGDHICHFDFPEIKVGCAHYPLGPTGVTIFSFQKRLRTVVDHRGGCPGTLFTDQLRNDNASLDALVFTGGSLYGLEAAIAISTAIFEERKKSTKWNDIALVSGAVIYDFTMRKSSLFPDKRLARAAFKAAETGIFPLGGRGCGAGASAGKWLYKNTVPEWTGQGAAFLKKGSTKIAVFTVVNSLGALYNRSNKVVRGHLNPTTKRRIAMPGSESVKPEGGNTTLTFVLVNHALESSVLRSLARQVHSSMARAIQPFHGLSDGDVLYAATTDSVKRPEHNSYQLAAMASECAWDAVLNSYKGRS